MGFINPAFLSFENFFDVLNNCATLGVMAVGVLLVMISGGMDVSFFRNCCSLPCMFTVSQCLMFHGRHRCFYAFCNGRYYRWVTWPGERYNSLIFSDFLRLSLHWQPVTYSTDSYCNLFHRAHITSIPKIPCGFW